MGNGASTTVMNYYKPRIPAFYPYPTSSNKSPYRVFFNSGWAHTYNSSWGNSISGAAYSSAGILEYERKLMFLHCWGRVSDGLSPTYTYDKYSHTYSVNFYSSKTNEHVTFSRHYDEVTKNDKWLHIESLIESNNTPSNLENDLLIMKRQKEKIEQQMKLN